MVRHVSMNNAQMKSPSVRALAASSSREKPRAATLTRASLGGFFNDQNFVASKYLQLP
jgi:hypothetical protein